MLAKGDTVKVIGTTVCGSGKEKECIPIGTICKVIEVVKAESDDNPDKETYVAIVPENEFPHSHFAPYFYLEKDVEKGHLEWVKD